MKRKCFFSGRLYIIAMILTCLFTGLAVAEDTWQLVSSPGIPIAPPETSIDDYGFATAGSDPEQTSFSYDDTSLFLQSRLLAQAEIYPITFFGTNYSFLYYQAAVEIWTAYGHWTWAGAPGDVPTTTVTRCAYIDAVQSCYGSLYDRGGCDMYIDSGTAVRARTILLSGPRMPAANAGCHGTAVSVYEDGVLSYGSGPVTTYEYSGKSQDAIDTGWFGDYQEGPGEYNLAYIAEAESSDTYVLGLGAQDVYAKASAYCDAACTGSFSPTGAVGQGEIHCVYAGSDNVAQMSMEITW